MIQYIYFVKCPNCDDEHFDFFDEAKAFALGCLGSKPIITQTEVCRNDFGECTDSKDLGTIWSWEDIENITDDEPAVSVFTRGDLEDLGEDDPEFAALGNSLDFEPEPAAEPEPEQAPAEPTALDTKPDNFRKPIPADMTIEQLVEAMEENEDTVECVCCQELYPKEECKHDEKHGWICPDCADEVVECTWCEELYDRSECRYEVDLGWLCDRCEAAIKSRGETLTFREGSYWDLLDEGVVPDEELANCVDQTDFEIWGVEPINDSTYKAVLLKRHENCSVRDEQKVYDEMLDSNGLFTFIFDKKGEPELVSWNVYLLRDLAGYNIEFEDNRYEMALNTKFKK